MLQLQNEGLLEGPVGMCLYEWRNGKLGQAAMQSGVELLLPSARRRTALRRSAPAGSIPLLLFLVDIGNWISHIGRYRFVVRDRLSQTAFNRLGFSEWPTLLALALLAIDVWLAGSSCICPATNAQPPTQSGKGSFPDAGAGSCLALHFWLASIYGLPSFMALPV